MDAVPPWVLLITGIVSVQVGAGLAGRMFGEVSPATLTGLRLWAAAAAMAAFGGRGLARTVRDLIRERAWRDSAGMAAGPGPRWPAWPSHWSPQPGGRHTSC
jgi:hypothetical protein